jgi:hypothetical protein
MSAAKNVYMYIAGFYIEKKLKINIPLPTTVFLRSSGNHVNTLHTLCSL